MPDKELQSLARAQVEKASRDSATRKNRGVQAALAAVHKDISVWRSAIRAYIKTKPNPSFIDNSFTISTISKYAEISVCSRGLLGLSESKYRLPGLKELCRNFNDYEFADVYAKELEILLGKPFAVRSWCNEQKEPLNDYVRRTEILEVIWK